MSELAVENPRAALILVHDNAGNPSYVVEPVAENPHLYRRYEITGPDYLIDRRYVGETEEDSWQAGEGERIFRHFGKDDSLASDGEVVIFQRSD